MDSRINRYEIIGSCMLLEIGMVRYNGIWEACVPLETIVEILLWFIYPSAKKFLILLYSWKSEVMQFVVTWKFYLKAWLMKNQNFKKTLKKKLSVTASKRHLWRNSYASTTVKNLVLNTLHFLQTKLLHLLHPYPMEFLVVCC